MKKTAKQLNQNADNALKSPICPKCKEEITYLEYNSEILESGSYSIEDGHDMSYDNTRSKNYYCSYCGEELFDDEEDAYNFLNI